MAAKKRDKVFISEADQYLFGQGIHYDIYKKLGAHVSCEDGKNGVLFAVTAAFTADKAFNERDERVGADAVKEAEKLLESTHAAGLGKLRADHEKWWRDYWGLSSVTLGDEELERFYYGSLYILAVAAPYGYSRVAPGLYGSMVTEDLCGWHNDFHLNYNFISPFYGVCAANRPDFIKAMLKPITDYLPMAKKCAVGNLNHVKADYVASRPDLARGIPGGALYPVGLLQGNFSELSGPPTNYWSQVMNAPMTAAFFCTYWEYTHDEEFWREAYPFLEATARFFVGWCEKEPLEGGGYRYSFYDSLGEGEGFCKNCSCTLEFVRSLQYTGDKGDGFGEADALAGLHGPSCGVAADDLHLR